MRSQHWDDISMVDAASSFLDSTVQYSTRQPYAARKHHGSMFDRTRVIVDRSFYIVGLGIFDLFGSCDLDFDPMTFIYESTRRPRRYAACVTKYELPTSRLSKLMVSQTSKLYTTQFRGWSKTMKRSYLRRCTSWSDDIDITMTAIPKFIFTFHTYGSMFDRTGVIVDRNFTLWE